jgi:4-amino-4-deoxy-L-arabinose transferase-like glycosyltransferase
MKTSFENIKNERVFDYILLILLALILVFVVYVRIRLLTVPLERDEGEYAYMGQLLLKGYAPFIHAYTMKLPGVSAIYALFMLLFGQTITAIHMGLLIVNSICTLFVFLLAQRLYGRQAALIACASYALLSLSESVLGIFAHATHFIVLFALAGFLLLLRALELRNLPILFWSGVCFGLSFIMKQHAAPLIVFAILYFSWRGFRREGEKRYFAAGVVVLLLGVTTPYLLLVLYLVWAGAFGPFWLWTVHYARAYTSISTPIERLQNFIGHIFPMYPLYPILLLAGVGIVACWRSREPGNDRPFVFGMLFFSFLAVCPGFFFRPHYFVPLLPALAILAGTGAISIGHRCKSQKLGRALPVSLLAVSAAFALYCESEYAFSLTPPEVSNKIYGPANNFNVATQIASYVRNHTRLDERIAVLGSEPEIYFYADRISATNYLYMYSLMEDQPYAQGMEAELIRDIESVAPAYIVVDNSAMLLIQKSIWSKSLFDWLDQYLRESYECVGAVDIHESDAAFYWDKNVAKYTTGDLTSGSITVFKHMRIKNQNLEGERKRYNGNILPGI